MPLNLIFTTAGNYALDDDDIAGNNTSVIRDATGTVIFTFVHPADSMELTTSVPGVNLAVNLADTFGTANFTIGSLTSAATSPESIAIGALRTSGTVTLAANGAVSELASDVGADIIAGRLVLSAATGVGKASNAIETQTSFIEAETTTGGITLSNFGSVQIGGIGSDVGGLRVETSGNINFSTVGTMLLGEDGATESVRGGSTSGNVTLRAKGLDSDILASVNRDSIVASAGNIVLQAGRDIGFGIVGSDFDNDVRASGGITINAGRDFLIDGFADLASDDFGTGTGGNITITAGRNIHVRSVAGTDGSIFANGNAGADVILTTGAGGALVVDPASSGASQPISSSSGDVIVNADRILINSTSGIGAANGQVRLGTATAGREIDLGSVGDAVFALQLSDAELDRVFAPTLAIGDNRTGLITVSAAISPANASNLVLRSGGDIAVQAAITTVGSLELRAGDSLLVNSATALTAGGALSIFVDTLGNDGGTGGFVDLSTAAVSAASIAINGAAEKDTLKGAESVDQTVHGWGGNDTIVSSGEGHYFGDAGNDLMLAGLSSGIVPEALDGGGGVDTLDTRSFNGNYVINLATGVTNFSYESFVNFENIVTGSGSDQIVGNAANNRLDGGAGADLMQGGAGNDVYLVDDAGDVADESVAGSGGIDRVESALAINLSAAVRVKGAVENATLTGTADVNVTGNALANLLTGNAGNNILDGKAGADTMRGLGGDDVYRVDNAGDLADESVAGSGGIDRVQSALAINLSDNARARGAIENATLTGTANVNAIGNLLANVLIGNAGNNVLDGKADADTMQGRGGNDVYLVDNAGDVADESVAGSGGIDRVQSALAINLSDAARVKGAVENATLTGTANVNVTGNALANALTGNAGNNVLDGKAGADTMSGGKGNDTYVVDNGSDTVVETSGEGIDLVKASVSHTLANDVEKLTLTGPAAINGTGNSLANVLAGNGAGNTLDGKAGNDVLKGGAGADQLIGRTGADDLYGGAGADGFVFKTVTDSTVAAAGRDTIFDFSRAEGDKIDLSAIDANTSQGGNQAFTFIGMQAFHNIAGELRYAKTGGDTYLHGDVNGDGNADFTIHVDALVSFVQADLLL